MIERLTSDSRRCAPGSAFFAWPGSAGDGRRHIAQAIERGAAAVLWESEEFFWNDAWRVPNEGVDDLKSSAGRLAHAFYGRPSESLWVCGVTGTNGKTTCSQWLAALLEAKTAVIGTLGSGFAPDLNSLENTTPDPLEIHRLLKDFKDRGAAAVAMEVSSHALDQERVNGVAFDCALLTNLTHDHLDYHGSMDKYGAAKARLFDAPGLEAAVINCDDAFGAQLAKRTAARTIGYGLSRPATEEFLLAERKIESLNIVSTWGSVEISFSPVGDFNIYNALGVLGCLIAKGIPFAQAAKLLERLPQVPGRMQKVGERPLVLVDYAHTPDALEKVLAALKPVAQARGGRLAVVFGAGGDRDAAKRPAMGAAAARYADRIVLTSDNPRSEKPAVILDAIQRGVGQSCEIEPDRARAIEAAVGGAAGQDVVLIAGKGHEQTQEIAGRKLPFSDAAVAAAALGRRGKS